MKGRESGMPDEEMWTAFFDPAEIFHKLQLNSGTGDVVEFGCGYGTFTIPAAQKISGTIYALDIEPGMVSAVQTQAGKTGLANIRVILRDFIEEGTGLPCESIDYSMLFNILHVEAPIRLLRESMRILKPGGKVAIIHWNYDSTTPRGPAMDIRPRPEQCLAWAEQAGFHLKPPGIQNLPPYHYGMVLVK